MAALFQHSPYVILSRKDRNIRSPGDLVNKSHARGRAGENTTARHAAAEGELSQAGSILPQTWSLDDRWPGGRHVGTQRWSPASCDRGVAPSMPALIRRRFLRRHLVHLAIGGGSSGNGPEPPFASLAQEGWTYAKPDEMADIILTLQAWLSRARATHFVAGLTTCAPSSCLT
jgi:hypothetical protein